MAYRELHLVTTIRVRDRGGPEGGFSVGGDRAASGGVTLTKEEKRKWKNRMKKQSSSAKTTCTPHMEEKTVVTMDKPVMHEDLPRTHTYNCPKKVSYVTTWFLLYSHRWQKCKHTFP